MTTHTPSDRRAWHRGHQPARPLALAVAMLAAVAFIGAVAELGLLFSGPPDPPWQAALFVPVAMIYVIAGALGWYRRPANRIGPLLVAAAFVWLIAGLGNAPSPALIAAGMVFGVLGLSIVIHLLLAFPSGRLRGRASRPIVAVSYFCGIVLQAPVYLFAPFAEPLRVTASHRLERIGFWIQSGVGAIAIVATAIVLVGRLRSATPAQQRVLAPLCVYGVAVVIFVPLSASVGGLVPLSDVSLLLVQLALLAIIPIAFTLAIGRGGFARTAELEELGAWLGAADSARQSLVQALAHALGDDTVQLLFWVPGAGGYVDARGHSVQLPPAGSGRAAVEVRTADRRVGTILYDTTLIADPAIVRDAGRVIALALDRERLTTELRASRESLLRSRARLVQAADDERRRIARDLHDGLQTRLILLSIAAARAGGEADDPDAVRQVTGELRSGVQSAIEELRELVRGVMPAALTQGGLYAAAEDLADRSPVPTELTLDPSPRPLSPAVEITGWFVMSEALTNAIKHADAGALKISLGTDSGQLRIEVADDGVGGAVADGGGLRSIADRVEAHDGTLLVLSPPGGGTRIVAEMPCGS